MYNEDYKDLIVDSFTMATEFVELCKKGNNNGD
jgi:hypothetical protein